MRWMNVRSGWFLPVFMAKWFVVSTVRVADAFFGVFVLSRDIGHCF